MGEELPPAASRVRTRKAVAAWATVVVGLGSLVLGINLGPPWFAGLLLLPFMVLHYIRERRLYAAALTLQRIVAEWGVGPVRKRDFAALQHFYQMASYERFSPAAPIDDQSWLDLNMNALYARIDHTCSVPGQDLLYELLRKPLIAEAPLQEREAIIRAFEKMPELRQKVQMILRGLGRGRSQGGGGAADALWVGMPEPTGRAWLYRLLALAAVAALGGVWVWGWVAVFKLVMPLFLLNMTVHYSMRSRMARDAETIKYLCRLVNAAARLHSLPDAELAEMRAFLSQPLALTRQVGDLSNLQLGEVEGTGDVLRMLLEYVSIYFLHEVRRYESLLSKIRDHGTSLRSIYQKVGEVDALQAIASYRTELGAWATPQFSEDGPFLEVVDVRHPLIADAVLNSICIRTHGIAITGSNMSGKTTFLRTLAVNVILAQTIGACCAGAYRGRFMRVVSSINEGDDLLAGKSYFLVEAERLLHMLRQAEGALTTLCLIDEPLAGTKSVDRHAALNEILRYLMARNAVGMLCTHDVDLVAEMGDVFCSYHFGDEVHATGVVSDFRLRDGLSYESNALKLLDHLGYPKEIVVRSMERLALQGERDRAAKTNATDSEAKLRQTVSTDPSMANEPPVPECM